MNKKAIVLLSGGIDSAVTLYLAKKKGFCPTALIFDYGQRHRKEIGFARRIAGKARSPYRIIKLSFPWKGSSLLDRKMHIPKRPFNNIKKGIPSTYVPGRNLIFLSIATSFAETIKGDAIFIGAHTQDFSGYPDCRKTFFDIFKKVITKGTKDGKRIKIYTPLLNKNKKEIIKIGLRLKVPFKFTWSCYEGSRNPCDSCDSCLFRKKAFEELGVKDPYHEKS
ncbi:MAG: 7-cyano-7-deazaguanine synthase QueC [Candidatus Omnitrophota bacterium]|nr:MAG: 7-cyano-7-deazaguanine synthase QueC [Candidatus Omnitrophota bacterium]